MTDIQLRQHVKILGYVAGADSVQAIQVKVETENKSSGKVKLQGPVTRIDSSFVSVLGVDVDTDAIPSDGFSSMQDGPVSRNEFFNFVIIGDTVGINGNLSGNEVEWGEIELLQEQ